jgi:hypothetical protein
MMNKSFYVYRHIHPETKETVYIGKGCFGRAWDVTRNRSSNKPHLNWLKDLCEMGHTPENIVVIDRQGLEEIEALRLEKEYLHTKGCPLFNRQSGEKNYQAKLTNEQARDIYLRAKNGENHTDLSKEFNVSRSAISMIATRRQWKAATACLV